MGKSRLTSMFYVCNSFLFATFTKNYNQISSSEICPWGNKDRQWSITQNTNGTALLKLDETESIERREFLNTLNAVKVAATEENIKMMHEMAPSQEGEPGTHKTAGKLLWSKITEDDLNLCPLRMILKNTSLGRKNISVCTLQTAGDCFLWRDF